MSSKHLRGDINYAWPTAEIAVMGAKVRVMARLSVSVTCVLLCRVQWPSYIAMSHPINYQSCKLNTRRLSVHHFRQLREVSRKWNFFQFSALQT